MRTLLCGVALSAAIAAPAMAETRYDRNLEKAVMGIVAGKIGDIRGSFSYKEVPKFVIMPEAPAAPVDRLRKEALGDLDDGLSPAVGRQVSRTIF
jgi:hypothetical protein